MHRLVFILAALFLCCTSHAATLQNCDEASLRTAIAAGGVVTFSCDTTIPISSTITISNQVTLDASASIITLSGGNSVRLFNVVSGGSLELVHLTLAGGFGTKGGAIVNEGGRVIANNCLFLTNRATGSLPNIAAEGGAIFNNGELTITNCEFRGNVASPGSITQTNQPAIAGQGGAIKSIAQTIIGNTSFLTNSAIGGNASDGTAETGETGGAAQGGSIFLQGITKIVSCVFSNNVTHGGAGGKGSFFYGRDGLGGPSLGAGIFLNTTTNIVSLEKCTFVGNSSEGGSAGVANRMHAAGGTGGIASGAIHLASGTLVALDNVWFQNQCKGGTGVDGYYSSGVGGSAFGGGLYAESGQLNATNNTFFANQISGGNGGFTSYSVPGSKDVPGGKGGDAVGGAIFIKFATANVLHTTIALNSVAPGSGGLCSTPGGVADISDAGFADGAGIRNESGTLLLGNSILATNYVFIPGQQTVSANCSGPVSDLQYNISSDWSAPFVMSGVDPKLGAFDFNGGPTKNFGLLPDSPAIDFSDPLNSPSMDQRGFSRTSGLSPDAGAYETALPAIENSDLTELKVRIAAGGSVAIKKPSFFLVSQTIDIVTNTVIDASSTEPAIFDGGRGSRVFNVHPGISFTLINAIVANGRSDEGAGLRNAGGVVTLQNCSFLNNIAVGRPGLAGTNSFAKLKIGGAGSAGSLGRGGAILSSGTLIISNTAFIGNMALGGRGGDGGAGGESSKTLLQGTACRNYSSGASGGPAGQGGPAQGGAIWTSGALNSGNLLFRSNEVIGGGGGSGGFTGGAQCLAFYATQPTNGGNGGIAEGGAIYAKGVSQLVNSSFVWNRATGGIGGSGGSLPQYSAGTTKGGTGGNGSDGFGGAIANQGLARLTNVTFGFNLAAGGAGGLSGLGPYGVCSSTNGNGGNASAGAINERGTNISQNCTFSGNVASPGLGGNDTSSLCSPPPGADGQAFASVIRVYNTPGNAKELLSGCIIAISNSQPAIVGTLQDNGYNLSNDPKISFTANSSRTNIDPLLLPLYESASLPFFPLSLLSPARNAMPASAAPSTDQRGILRPVGALADIGAIEIAMPEIPPRPELLPNNSLSLTYEAHPDTDYVLYESSTLDNWTTTSTNRAAADGSLIFSPIDTSPPRNFFYLKDLLH